MQKDDVAPTEVDKEIDLIVSWLASSSRVMAEVGDRERADALRYAAEGVNDRKHKSDTTKRPSLRSEYVNPRDVAARPLDNLRSPCAECGKVGDWDCDTDCCTNCRQAIQGGDNAQG